MSGSMVESVTLAFFFSASKQIVPLFVHRSNYLFLKKKKMLLYIDIFVPTVY